MPEIINSGDPNPKSVTQIIENKKNKNKFLYKFFPIICSILDCNCFMYEKSFNFEISILEKIKYKNKIKITRYEPQKNILNFYS